MASLSLSAVVNLLITGWLYYFLRSLQREIGLSSRYIRLLTRFTLVSGGFTSGVIVVSLIFWVFMPKKPACFIALYFIIGKQCVVISYLPTRTLRMKIWEFREMKNAWGNLILSPEEFYNPHQLRNGESLYYPREDIQQLCLPRPQS
ncbi:hypothetical protein ARMGADRAFT_611519 [Armillaria gallica]|uniref:DUF6534 domain-containing protein n=1 Tax=Armillaria gallica TaxID=47427 RepID=A0A2H3D9J9_ARMGA|nr:hypothetical protein ARMGADRAFT_611519 [Armillaria gallica]